MNKSSPTISVIIAVYNGMETLQDCLDSIAKQSYENIELIIMDGASTDGTVDIIKANQDVITYWESKSDRGIYHAWNKALSHVQGDWVTFIGADDAFSDSSVLSEMIACSQANECNFISGRMKIFFKDKTVEKGEPWDIDAMRKWQNIAHPGALHHKKLFDKFGYFDENYKIAGDYEFLIRVSNEIKGCFLDKVLVHMGGEGVSNTRILPVLFETFKLQKTCQEIGTVKAVKNLVIAYLKSLLRKFK